MNVILPIPIQFAIMKINKINLMNQKLSIQAVDLTTLVLAGTTLETSILMLEVMKPALALNQLHLMLLQLILMDNSQDKLL